MNYLYDILLNFNFNLYDFYEWNIDDNIINIRKIPIVRVDKKIIFDIINSKIKFDKSIFTRIYNKTEIFNKNKIELIKYTFIIACENNILAIKLNDDGLIIAYSRLLLDEENEALDYIVNLEKEELIYSIISPNRIYFKTREEVEINRFLYREINKLIEKEEYEKLEYIYLEIFNDRKDIKQIKEKIFLELNKKWDSVYLKLYNLLKFSMIR